MISTWVRVSNARRISNLKSSLNIVKQSDYAKEFVDKAYDYARNIAPHDTGALKAAIQKVYQKNRGRLRLVQPINPKDNLRGQRPYHMWFHGYRTPSAGAKGYDLRGSFKTPAGGFTHIKSGIPDFMFKTRIHMESLTKNSIDKQVKSLFK